MWYSHNHLIMGNIHFETLRLGRSEQQFSDCHCSTEFVSRRKYYACSEQKHNIHCHCPTHVLEHSSRSEGWGCREDLLNNNRGTGFDPDWAVGRHPHLEPINPRLRECHSFNPVTKTLRGYETFNPFKPGSSVGSEPAANPHEGSDGLGAEWGPGFKSQQYDPLISQLPHDTVEIIEPFGMGNEHGHETPILATTSGSASPIAVYRSGTTFFPVRQPSKNDDGILTPMNGLIPSDTLNYGTSSPIAIHETAQGSTMPDIFAGSNDPSSVIPKEPTAGKDGSPLVSDGTKTPVGGRRQSFGIIIPPDPYGSRPSSESPHSESETHKAEDRTGPTQQLTSRDETRPYSHNEHVQHESPYRKVSSHDDKDRDLHQIRKSTQGSGEQIGSGPFLPDKGKHGGDGRTNQTLPHPNASPDGSGNDAAPNQNPPRQDKTHPLVSSGPPRQIHQDESDRNNGARAHKDSSNRELSNAPGENKGTYSPPTGNSASIQHPQQRIPSGPFKGESTSNFPRSQGKEIADDKDKAIGRFGGDTTSKNEGPAIGNSTGPSKTRSHSEMRGDAHKTTRSHEALSKPKSVISKAFLFDDFFDEPPTPSVSRRQLPAEIDTDERRPKRNKSQPSSGTTIKKEDKRKQAAVPGSKSENGGYFLPKLVKTLSSMVKLRFDEETAIPLAKEPATDRQKEEPISRTDSTQALFQRPWKEQRSNLDSGTASPSRTMVDERALSFYDREAYVSTVTAVAPDSQNPSATEVLRNVKPSNETVEGKSIERARPLAEVRKPLDTSIVHPTTRTNGSNAGALTHPTVQPTSLASANYPYHGPAEFSTSDRSTPQIAKVVDASGKPMSAHSLAAPSSTRITGEQDNGQGFHSVPTESVRRNQDKHSVPLSTAFEKPNKDANVKPENQTKLGNTKNLLPGLATGQRATPSVEALGAPPRTTSGLPEVHMAAKLAPVAHDLPHTQTAVGSSNEYPKVYPEIGDVRREDVKLHPEGDIAGKEGPKAQDRARNEDPNGHRLFGNERNESQNVPSEIGTARNDGRKVHPQLGTQKNIGPKAHPEMGTATNDGPDAPSTGGTAGNEGLKLDPLIGRAGRTDGQNVPSDIVIPRNEDLKLQPVTGTERNEGPNVHSGLVTKATGAPYNSNPRRSHKPLSTENLSGGRNVPPAGKPLNLDSGTTNLTLRNQEAAADLPNYNKTLAGNVPHKLQHASPEQQEPELTLHMRPIEEIKLAGPFVMPSSFPSATLMPEVHKSHPTVDRKENSDDGKRPRAPQVSERIQANVKDSNRQEDKLPAPAAPSVFPRNDGIVRMDEPQSPADFGSSSRPASNVDLNPLQQIRTSFPPYYSHQKLYVPSPTVSKNRVSRTAGEAEPQRTDNERTQPTHKRTATAPPFAVKEDSIGGRSTVKTNGKFSPMNLTRAVGLAKNDLAPTAMSTTASGDVTPNEEDDISSPSYSSGDGPMDLPISMPFAPFINAVTPTVRNHPETPNQLSRPVSKEALGGTKIPKSYAADLLKPQQHDDSASDQKSPIKLQTVSFAAIEPTNAYPGIKKWVAPGFSKKPSHASLGDALSDSGVTSNVTSVPASMVGTTPDLESLPSSEDNNDTQGLEPNNNSESSIVVRPTRNNAQDARKKHNTWLQTARLFLFDLSPLSISFIFIGGALMGYLVRRKYCDCVGVGDHLSLPMQQTLPVKLPAIPVARIRPCGCPESVPHRPTCHARN